MMSKKFPSELQVRYRDRLQAIPPPGAGCHTALLGVANLGVMAGVGGDQIFSDMRQAIPPGDRRVSDKEILEAITKAAKDFSNATPIPPKPKPMVQDGREALRRIIERGKTCHEADILSASPVRIDWPPEEDFIHALPFLYEGNDLLFIGESMEPGVPGRNIKPIVNWSWFPSRKKPGPFFIINPLTGTPAPRKDMEKDTFRGDSNVRSFYYALIEFDNLPMEDQIRFWSAVPLPIRALINTGGKSIHGLIDVQKLGKIESQNDWDRTVKGGLFDQVLTPLGVDGSCKNPSRLSRLPGHFREEKGKYQRVIWLSQEGREIF